MPFQDFVDALDPVLGQLKLQCAIECVMTHSGKGVLLLVDEIMKHKKADKIVSAIGACLDTLSTQFNAIITTLNSVAFTTETTCVCFLFF